MASIRAMAERRTKAFKALEAAKSALSSSLKVALPGEQPLTKDAEINQIQVIEDTAALLEVVSKAIKESAKESEQSKTGTLSSDPVVISESKAETEPKKPKPAKAKRAR